MKEITDIIARLSRLIVQMEDEAREQFNFSELTLTQMHYLETLRNLKNPNLTELATALELTKPTVTVAIEKLAEKDYVRKVQSDADRRSAHLHLTEKGNLINQMHDFAHRRIAEEMFKEITQEEMTLLVNILSKVVK
jgi:DNA-binding MarR family transcriptional regulator